NKRLGKEITGISDQALAALTDYSWPGNVRELEHVMERACVLCTNSTITTDHLSYEFSVNGYEAQRKSQVESAEEYDYLTPEPVDDAEGEADRIVRILTKCSGNKAKAARLLGIDRSTLYRKMRLYNIDPSAF
ncbi:MAG: helix-turn-helix domain-containing protein, partial [Desulfobulbales bacterium]